MKKFFVRAFWSVRNGKKFVRSFNHSAVHSRSICSFVRFVRSFNSFDPYTRMYARYACTYMGARFRARSYIIRLEGRKEHRPAGSIQERHKITPLKKVEKNCKKCCIFKYYH